VVNARIHLGASKRMMYSRLGLTLIVLACSSCGPDGREEAKNNENQKVALGQVRMGNEATEFYIAYGPDEAILGFSVPDATGSARYFPMFASTYGGIPAVVLDIFVSKTEDQMWVRSSWPTAEVLAYRRLGSDTAITEFGDVTFLREPLPKELSGGPVRFPEMITTNVLKKATFEVKGDR
jgi:hypothetical protein